MNRTFEFVPTIRSLRINRNFNLIFPRHNNVILESNIID